MSLCGRVEVAVESDVPGEKYHNIFCSSTITQLPSMSPDTVQAVHLLNGEWGKDGSTICSEFKLDGASKVIKQIIEDIDNSQLSSTFRVYEGDLLEAYKSFKIIPNCQGNVVRWTLIYEKKCENIPDPTAFLDFLVHLTKDMNAYLTQAQT